jgi:hypothetical protein
MQILPTTKLNLGHADKNRLKISIPLRIGALGPSAIMQPAG